MNSWFGLTISALAAWRLCHLVASEDGPFDLIARLRRAAGQGVMGRAMDCPWCLSLWFSIPFAAWLSRDVAEFLALWLAISGGACLIEALAAMLIARGEPPVIDLPGEPGP